MANFRIMYFQGKASLQLLKAFILAVFAMVLNMEVDSINGKMVHFIKESITKDSEKEKEIFSTQKTQAPVAAFGKMAYYKVKVSTYKEEKYINAFGVVVSWWG